MRRRRFAPIVESLESRLLLSRSGLFAVIDTPNEADDNDQLQNQTTSDEVADQRDRMVAADATSNDDILQSDDEQLEPSQNRDLQVDVVRNVADEEPVDDADRNDVPVVIDDTDDRIVIQGVDQVNSDKVGDDRIVVDQIGDDGTDLASDLNDGVSVVDGDETDADEDEPRDSRKTDDDEVDDDDGSTDGTVAIFVDRVSETDDEPDGDVLQLTVTAERLPIGHSQSVTNDTNELAQSDSGATATENEADENSILTATNEENHESTELSNSELVVAPLFTAVVLRAVHRASTSNNRDVWRDSNFANGDGFGAPRREQRRRQRDRDFGIPTKLRKRSLPYAGPPPEDVEEEFRDKPSQLEHTNLVFITPLSDWTNSEYSSEASRSEAASGLEASAGIVIVGAAVSSVATGVAVSRTKSRRNRNRSRKAGNTTPLYTGPTIDQIR